MYTDKIKFEQHQLKNKLDDLEKQMSNNEISASTYLRNKRKLEHGLSNVEYTTTRLNRFVTITTLEDKPVRKIKKDKKSNV